MLNVIECLGTCTTITSVSHQQCSSMFFNVHQCSSISARRCSLLFHCKLRAGTSRPSSVPFLIYSSGISQSSWIGNIIAWHISICANVQCSNWLIGVTNYIQKISPNSARNATIDWLLLKRVASAWWASSLNPTLQPHLGYNLTHKRLFVSLYIILLDQ